MTDTDRRTAAVEALLASPQRDLHILTKEGWHRVLAAAPEPTAERLDVETLRDALAQTAASFHAIGWHDRPTFGHHARTFEACLIERCVQNRAALAAAPEPTAERLDVGLLNDLGRFVLAEEGSPIRSRRNRAALLRRWADTPAMDAERLSSLISDRAKVSWDPHPNGRERTIDTDYLARDLLDALARPADETGSER